MQKDLNLRQSPGDGAGAKERVSHEGSQGDILFGSSAQAEELTCDSFSSRILGRDWETAFPFETGSGVQVDLATFETVSAFIAAHSTEFSDQAWESEFGAQSENSNAKRRYYREVGDFFVFSERGKIVGVFTGNLLDWDTYYWRYTLALSAYRGLHFYQEFLHHFIQLLRTSGVNRIEADVAPSNSRNIHILNKIGFVPSGMSLTDRWGALLRFTYFTQTADRQCFSRSFCHGHWNPRDEEERRMKK